MSKEQVAKELRKLRQRVAELDAREMDRKRAEEAFRKKEWALAEAQRIAHLGNWDWNIVTNELVWSDEIYRIFGLQPQEFGATYEAFLNSVHPGDRGSVKQAVNRALADPGVGYSIEHRVVRPDGSERLVHERGEVTFNDEGRPVRMIGTVHDITDRKQIEEDLRESRNFLQSVIDGIADPIMVVDCNHRVLLANRAIREFAGEDPVRNSLNCFQVLHQREKPCDSLMEPCPLERAIATKKPTQVIHHHRDRSGQEIIVEVNAAPILEQSGEVTQLIECCRDITERKRAEEETRRLLEQLNHVTRVATLGELGASLAHELNQPLAAILSNAQAAQRFLAGEVPDLEEVQQALADIVKDDQRAGEVIRRLRALLKSGDLERAPVDINEITEEIVSLLHSEAVVKDVCVKLELAADLPPVLGDRIQLQQVLMNLLVNGIEAIGAAGSGSRELMVRTCRTDSSTIEVAVKDSGTGIDEENMGRIFTPFFTTKDGGMGMGLSISRSIVQVHGGQLWATNNPDGGATFRFTLPVGGKD